jgi:hypothetical protein
MAALLLGRGERNSIDSYYQFEDYESNGKKACFAFHWREYSPPELARLFATSGFEIQRCGSFTAFQGDGRVGFGRRLARFLSRTGTSLFPRYGTNVYLIATRKKP